MDTLRIIKTFQPPHEGYWVNLGQTEIGWKVRGASVDEQFANVTRFADYMKVYNNNPELLVDNFHELFVADGVNNPLATLNHMFSFADELLLDAAAEGGQAIDVWSSEAGESMLEVIAEVGELLAAALL